MARYGEDEHIEWMQDRWADAAEGMGEEPDWEEFNERLMDIAQEEWDDSAHSALWDFYVEIGYHDPDDERDVFY